MGYPYRFVNLDDEQNTRRRHLLDSYGRFAQLSILLVPLAYQLSFGIRLVVSRLSRLASNRSAKEHKSPVVARFAQSPAPPWRNLVVRLRWILDEEVVEGWGTWQEWSITGLWATWLFVLAVKDTGDDYLHLTKRFGIVAASQLPLHYALALKSWSPIQYLTGLSHEQLNPYHRLLGRIIITFFSLHASMYLNFYVQKGLLLKRIRDWDVILGLAAITTALLLGSTALSRIRNWNYRLFFYSHVILSITLLPTLYLHVSHLRIYVLEAAAIYILLILQRNSSQASADATITQLPCTNLLSITIPLTKALCKKTYTPGQHIYLGFPSLAQKLRINPFSIANPYPRTDRNIHLVARKLNGTTAFLAGLASTVERTAETSVPLLIEGPYGSAAHLPNIASFDRVLLVAGGVGATFTLPLYVDLLRQEKSGGRIPPVRFVWTVRTMADAEWGLEMLKEQLGGVQEGVELYFTGTNHERKELVVGNSVEIELQERERLMDGTEEYSDGSAERDRLGGDTKRGRPDLRVIVDETFAGDANNRVAVLICGPKGMGKSVRREIGRWVAKGRDVFWHSEEFGW